MELTPNDLLDGFGGEKKRYGTPTAPIAGVEILPAASGIVDDRGLFLEIYRNAATHPSSEKLVRFFDGVEIAQLNYSLVTAQDHVKGLALSTSSRATSGSAHRRSKLKVVLLDARRTPRPRAAPRSSSSAKGATPG